MDPKTAITTWFEINPNNAQIWQLLDSFASHWQNTCSIPSAYQFPVIKDLAGAANTIEQYLKSLPHEAIDAELASFEHLRPDDLPRLPVIPAGPSVADRMAGDQTHRYQPDMVRGFEHAEAMQAAYDILNDKKKNAAVPDCRDFPEDEQAQSRLAGELFAAIVDCSNTEEKPRVVTRKTKKRKHEDVAKEEEEETTEYRDNTHVKRVKMAKDIEITLVAWKLLKYTREAQSGRVGLGPWTTNWDYEQYPTFMDRFEAVKEVCLRSKAVVASMMTADHVHTKRLAAGPQKEIKQKKQNKETNILRDKQNKIAICALKSGLFRLDDDGEPIDPQGRRVIPTPSVEPTPELEADNTKFHDSMTPETPYFGAVLPHEQQMVPVGQSFAPVNGPLAPEGWWPQGAGDFGNGVGSSAVMAGTHNTAYYAPDYGNGYYAPAANNGYTTMSSAGFGQQQVPAGDAHLVQWQSPLGTLNKAPLFLPNGQVKQEVRNEDD